MNINVYTTSTCPYCKMLKDYLDRRGVTYTERLVDQDDTVREEMMQASGGFLGVPFTVVEKGDGMKETVVGFDRGRLNSLMGLT